MALENTPANNAAIMIFIFGPMIFLAAIICSIWAGVDYFKYHEESALGWFVTGIVIIALPCVVPMIGGLGYWGYTEYQRRKGDMSYETL